MTISSGMYAPDGSFRITVLSNPSTYTGVYAADGSFNVVSSPGNVYVGAYHPCGAWWVTLQAAPTYYLRNVDGSLNVSVSSYKTGTQRVTVVSGSFGPGNTSPSNIVIFNFGY